MKPLPEKLVDFLNKVRPDATTALSDYDIQKLTRQWLINSVLELTDAVAELQEIFSQVKAIETIDYPPPCGGEMKLVAPVKPVSSQEKLSDSGQALFNDLAHRLIRRILEFNPNEHDIELNLAGIIEKAKNKADKPKEWPCPHVKCNTSTPNISGNLWDYYCPNYGCSDASDWDICPVKNCHAVRPEEKT